MDCYLLFLPVMQETFLFAAVIQTLKRQSKINCEINNNKKCAIIQCSGYISIWSGYTDVNYQYLQITDAFHCFRSYVLPYECEIV